MTLSSGSYDVAIAVLVSLGVPFSGLIALFVGVADLIPLVAPRSARS